MVLRLVRAPPWAGALVRGVAIAMMLLGSSVTSSPASAEEVWPSQDPIERGTPAELVLLTPTRAPGPVSGSVVSARFRSVVPEHTSLELGESASEALARCGSSLSCLVQASERTGVAYVILAANLTTRDANIISASLLDLSLARAVVQEGGQDIDARLEREAIIAASPDYEVRTATEAQAAVDRIVLTDLWPIIEKRGLGRRFGALLVRSELPGARVSLDGRLLGTTPGSDDPVRIQRVRPGKRTITFETDDYLPWSTAVDVSAGTSPEVRFERPATSTLQAALPWTGAGIALAGTAVLIAAIAIPERSTCLYVSAAADCSRSDFKAWGPILAAPLGYSMMATGATWLLIPGFSAKDRGGWEVLIGGLLLGVVAYAVSALANSPVVGDPVTVGL